MQRRRAKTIEEDGVQLKVVHIDRVSRARSDLIEEDQVHLLSSVYKVLGDPTRLRIALALLGGEMCVSDLSAALLMSDSAVSHQLRRLRDRGLVKSRRDGPLHYYSLDDEHVVSLLQIGLDHIEE